MSEKRRRLEKTSLAVLEIDLSAFKVLQATHERLKNTHFTSVSIRHHQLDQHFINVDSEEPDYVNNSYESDDVFSSFGGQRKSHSRENLFRT